MRFYGCILLQNMSLQPSVLQGCLASPQLVCEALLPTALTVLLGGPTLSPGGGSTAAWCLGTGALLQPQCSLGGAGGGGQERSWRGESNAGKEERGSGRSHLGLAEHQGKRQILMPWNNVCPCKALPSTALCIWLSAWVPSPTWGRDHHLWGWVMLWHGGAHSPSQSQRGQWEQCVCSGWALEQAGAADVLSIVTALQQQLLI